MKLVLNNGEKISVNRMNCAWAFKHISTDIYEKKNLPYFRYTWSINLNIDPIKLLSEGHGSSFFVVGNVWKHDEDFTQTCKWISFSSVAYIDASDGEAFSC